jgi:hypothetical protein
MIGRQKGLAAHASPFFAPTRRRSSAARRRTSEGGRKRRRVFVGAALWRSITRSTEASSVGAGMRRPGQQRRIACRGAGSRAPLGLTTWLVGVGDPGFRCAAPVGYGITPVPGYAQAVPGYAQAVPGYAQAVPGYAQARP